ncbi:unnamed protein product, partial [Ectocarpus sp. 12 AP-2014]
MAKEEGKASVANRATKRRRGSSASVALLASAALLSLVRCSEAFLLPPAAHGAFTIAQPLAPEATHSSSSSSSSSRVPMRRDARRERMATLGKVRWQQPVESGRGASLVAAG